MLKLSSVIKILNLKILDCSVSKSYRGEIQEYTIKNRGFYLKN